MMAVVVPHSFLGCIRDGPGPLAGCVLMDAGTRVL